MSDDEFDEAATCHSRTSLFIGMVLGAVGMYIAGKYKIIVI